MGTSCALLADLFLYSFEADFILQPLKKEEKKVAWSSLISSKSKRTTSYGIWINREMYTPSIGAAGILNYYI
jgi:hypothetical protein